MSLLHNSSLFSVVVTFRRISQKMFDIRRIFRAKSSIFSTISFAAIFIVIIFADSIISNLSLHSVAFGTRKTFHTSSSTPIPLLSMIEEVEKLKLSSTPIPLLSMKEKIEEDFTEDQNHLIPPFNVTEEERILWFRKRLPEFEIFKSTRLTQQFDGRVREFFNRECKVQFFMTWISPVRSFGRREFFAMESLFKAHPHGCLMILSRTLDSIRGYMILKPLLDRGFRVLAVTPDLSFLFKNTPAEAWFNEMKNGHKDPGEIPLAQNLSNLLRLAVLFKYGGVYLDTDFIVLKEFSGVRNTIGAQSIDGASGNWTRLNNAVLVFDKNHPLLYKFIEEFALTFDGNKWGHNGPYLVSRVVNRVTRRPGYNFTVLPPMAFYPVCWNKIGGLFKQPNGQANSRWVEGKLRQLSGQTYGLHLWNRQSSRLKIEVGSIIGRLISDHCVICEQIYSS